MSEVGKSWSVAVNRKAVTSKKLNWLNFSSRRALISKKVAKILRLRVLTCVSQSGPLCPYQAIIGEVGGGTPLVLPRLRLAQTLVTPRLELTPCTRSPPCAHPSLRKNSVFSAPSPSKATIVSTAQGLIEQRVSTPFLPAETQLKHKKISLTKSLTLRNADILGSKKKSPKKTE